MEWKKYVLPHVVELDQQEGHWGTYIILYSFVNQEIEVAFYDVSGLVLHNEVKLKGRSKFQAGVKGLFPNIAPSSMDGSLEIQAEHELFGYAFYLLSDRSGLRLAMPAGFNKV